MREYARRKCGKPAERRGELWENLAVVWEDAGAIPLPVRRGPWLLTTVINHSASADPSAPKYVTHSELLSSALFRDCVVEARSKEEAMLKYAVAGGRGHVWSLEGGIPVRAAASAFEESTLRRRYRLVEEAAM